MMKAIALRPGTSSIHLIDCPIPEIRSAHEILVRVLQVGVCGTDREEVHGGRADAPFGSQELILGHEMVGQVVSIGKGVTRFQPGDDVVVSVRRGCDACPACKALRSDMCMTGQYKERGIKGLHGFQAEYIVDEEQYAVKVPREITSIAVLTEPMSVVEKALSEAGILQTHRLPYLKDSTTWLQGKRALIAGLGPIGLLGALALRLRGAEVIGLDIVEPSNRRATLLSSMGGTYLQSRTLNSAQVLAQYGAMDLILDAVGNAQLDLSLLDLLGINGILVLLGVPGRPQPLTCDGAAVLRALVLKNQLILGSVNETIHHFEQAIVDLTKGQQTWPHLLPQLITRTFSPQDYQVALTEHMPDEIKIIIKWSDP